MSDARRWEWLRHGQVYVAPNGEIIGEVTSAFLSGGYYATVGAETKRFVDEASAKRFVEATA